MKWPKELTLIRHDVSAYNAMKETKLKNRAYQDFLASFEEDPESEQTRTLARIASSAISLGVTDQDTGLANEAANAIVVGQRLQHEIVLPDVVFVSPYTRTRETYVGLVKGWPELGEVRIVEEERVREQEHGLSTLYNDYKIFQALHPDQRAFQDLYGPMSRYWYRFPQGENVPDVRDRIRSFTSTLVRDWDSRGVLVITHHLTILGFRANHERLSAEEFLRLDDDEKPINCGVTLYKGNPNAGSSGGGKLELSFYNKRLY